jgi:hypothetical protein
MRHFDGTGGIVVVEPLHTDEAPFQEELCRQRGHGQIEALDPQDGSPKMAPTPAEKNPDISTINDDFTSGKMVVSL